MALPSNVQAALDAFIEREQLPADYANTVETWFLPLAEEVLQLVARSTQAPIVGVSGCQGSGKSTLASLLVLLVRELMGLRAVNLSIDDFYHTHATRQRLAHEVHPLFATRGVPGTHDVPLALATLDALRAGGQVPIPRFDKSVDDRHPPEAWPQIAAPVDLIVLEGWCLSVPAQPDAALQQPINALEAEEDCVGAWRQHVNRSIRDDYARFYGMVDFLIMLKAPDFAKVAEWRGRAEQKLAAQAGAAGHRVMNERQLARFIQHYERLTRHGLEVLPQQADVVFQLTDAQTIAGRQ
jgi:D-glycerate 3-kinase